MTLQSNLHLDDTSPKKCLWIEKNDTNPKSDTCLKTSHPTTPSVAACYILYIYCLFLDPLGQRLREQKSSWRSSKSCASLAFMRVIINASRSRKNSEAVKWSSQSSQLLIACSSFIPEALGRSERLDSMCRDSI